MRINVCLVKHINALLRCSLVVTVVALLKKYERAIKIKRILIVAKLEYEVKRILEYEVRRILVMHLEEA